jgi:hypothetical protein
MKLPEHVRRQRVETYLTERARRRRVEEYLGRVMRGLVGAVIESALTERIREKLQTEDGILSMTHGDWDFAERAGMVSLQRVKK